MAGYYGYSMSNNAMCAYDNGEMPLSKWTKNALIDSISECELKADINLIKKLTAKELREKFLYKSSWHHTSIHFNKTDFYSIDAYLVESMTDEDIIAIINSRVAKKNQEKPQEVRGRIVVNVWGGSYGHRKIIGTDERVGVVKGDWLVFDGGKYKISANKTISFTYLK